MELIGGEVSLWSDFEGKAVVTPDAAVLMADPSLLWTFVATRVVEGARRILAVGPTAVAALATAATPNWDAVLRSSCDARATEPFSDAGTTVYCGSAVRFAPDETYDLVLCFDPPSLLVGPEDTDITTADFIERCLSWATDALFVVDNAGSLLRRRDGDQCAPALADGAFADEHEAWNLHVLSCFGSSALVSPQLRSTVPLSAGLLGSSGSSTDALRRARALGLARQAGQQAPRWLWGTTRTVAALPTAAWVEPSPTVSDVRNTNARVLFVEASNQIRAWPEAPLRVGALVRTCPNAELPVETLEDRWVAAISSPSALRGLVRDWSASLEELPSGKLPFASPDAMDRNGVLIDLGWRWEKPLTPAAARRICLMRFARRLVSSGTPHQWHALSSVDDIATALLLMCGVESAPVTTDAGAFEGELSRALLVGGHAEEVRAPLLEGTSATAQLEALSPDQLRRLLGLLSTELRTERDKADAEAVRARSQDWRIGKLSSEIAAYRRSAPYRVHRLLTAPKRIVKSQLKATLAKVLPASAQAKIGELLRRAQRESGQNSS